MQPKWRTSVRECTTIPHSVGFSPDMSGYVKPIKMGIYEILLMRHIYEYGVAYNLEGASPLEMMQATAFECQKKCVDMFPACTAGKWASKL